MQIERIGQGDVSGNLNARAFGRKVAHSAFEPNPAAGMHDFTPQIRANALMCPLFVHDRTNHPLPLQRVGY
jgi:hypothetical protein